MRSWVVDQFEFEEPHTEERLEIHAARRSAFPFPDPASFVAASAGARNAQSLASSVPFAERFAYGMVRNHLLRFAGLELPHQCEWPTFVLSDGPDEWHLILCGPDQFISYCWSTTA
jgi:hypothetical protein